MQLAFVCLFVCLLEADLHEKFTTDVSLDSLSDVGHIKP